MTRDIYEQHEAAFPNVSAYVVALDGKRVATIAFKFGNAVTVYLHWLGEPMVRDQARGGGYDRQSAALSSAAKKLTIDSMTGYLHDAEARADDMAKLAPTSHSAAGALKEVMRLEAEITSWHIFRDALTPDDGAGWNDRLRNAGFDVWQAV